MAFEATSASTATMAVLQQARVFDAVNEGLNRVLDRLAKRSGNL
jgi:hypothetical protein